MKNLLLFSISFFCLLSCGQKKENKQEIIAYFNALEDSGFVAPFYTGSADDDSKYDSLSHCLKLLQAYANGESETFPAREVSQVMDDMALGIANSLSPCRTLFGDSLEYYADRFVQTAYENCPDVSLIADAVSDDGSWAVRIYPNPMNSYVFYLDGQGRKRMMKNNQIVYTMDSIRQIKPGRYECKTGKPYRYSFLRAVGGENKIGKIHFSPLGVFEVKYE